jgi:hypothetical protein
MGLIFLVQKGEAEVKTPTHQYLLKAPPGPAMLHVDHLGEAGNSPQHLDKVPEWAAEEGDNERARKVKVIIAHFREVAKTKSIGEALDEAVQSDDPTARRTAIYAMGALDELPRLGQALRTAKHPDVWDNAVIALRHWLGRGPGQDLLLYNGLINQAKFTPRSAEIFVQLLHGFSKAQLAQPETYETLIDYLQSDRAAIRALAHWYLVRLVPEGKNIEFKPYGNKEEREHCYKEWCKMIPSGRVPARPGAGGKE